MTAGELLVRMSSRELSEWMAFYELEPFGYERQEVVTAQLTAVVANMMRGSGRPPYKTKDFMPEFGRKAAQPVKMMKEMAKMMTVALGGKVG